MEPDQLEPDQLAARRSARSWVWYGGRPSLDLVNTRRDRQGSGLEYLREPADLAGWLHAAGHGDLAVDAGALAQARELREAIDAGVRAAVAGQPFPVPELETLNRWLAVAPVISPQLGLSGGVAVLRPAEIPRTVTQVLGDIARDAAELLGTGQRSGCGSAPVPAAQAVHRRLPGRAPPLVLDGGLRQPQQGRDAPPGGARLAAVLEPAVGGGALVGQDLADLSCLLVVVPVQDRVQVVEVSGGVVAGQLTLERRLRGVRLAVVANLAADTCQQRRKRAGGGKQFFSFKPSLSSSSSVPG